MRNNTVVPLIALERGSRGIVVDIKGGYGLVRRLSDLGITRGVIVEVSRVAPLHGPLEIVVRGVKLALGRGVAAKIYVTPLGE